MNLLWIMAHRFLNYLYTPIINNRNENKNSNSFQPSIASHKKTKISLYGAIDSNDRHV